VRRRQFITLLGSAAAAAWPIAARAQQAAMPVIGFLHAGSPHPGLAVFRQTLAEAGYIENKNVTVEYRYSEAGYDQLAGLAANLVQRSVNVIVALPNPNAARAAKAATNIIPIVFLVSDDPVRLGLVASLSHPGGNATGVNFFISELAAKRLSLLRELLPGAARVGALVNPTAANTDGFVKDVTAAASIMGIRLELAHARDSHEIEAAFAILVGNKVDGLIVAPDAIFATTRRAQIVTLATRHGIPAIYTGREYAEWGGLMSYGSSVPDAYRQLAIYTGRILKGEKPADLPVVQSTKFDFVINLSTARALGLEIPPKLLALADDVIE
jgi:putative ABC transport system substrate-binding protein